MIEPSTLRESSQAHLDGHPPPRRVVMLQLQNAADEIERLRGIIASAFDDLDSGDESGCYLILKNASAK